MYAAYLVDRLTDDLFRQVPGLSATDAREVADRLVDAYLTRDGKALEELHRARSALSEIRTLTLASARAGTTEVPLPKGDVLDVLSKWGFR
jgi:hypothetical protein